jgi:CelD/BcsL family acetyltransferase involved in cellulose biosynthesis
MDLTARTKIQSAAHSFFHTHRQNTMAADAISFDVVDDIERFRALQREWDDLWRLADGQFFQSFAFCHASLIAEEKGSRRKLHCVTGRQNGRLVFVWPLVTYWNSVWKYAAPLAPRNRSPSDILVAPECGSEPLVKSAWDAALKSTGADIVELWRVRSSSLLCRCATTYAATRRTQIEPTYYASLRGLEDWEAFCRSRPGRSKHPDYLKRKLAKHIDFNLEVLDRNDARTSSVVNWLVSHKREWAHVKDIDSQWVFSESSDKFWGDLMLNRTYEAGVMRVFVLWHLQRPIAALIVAVGAKRVDFLTVTYDMELAKLSPGTVLLDEGVKWAFEHGLDVDFTPGSEPYKVSWSGRASYTTSSFLVLPTTWGLMGYRAKMAAKKLQGMMGRAVSLLSSRHAEVDRTGG